MSPARIRGYRGRVGAHPVGLRPIQSPPDGRARAGLGRARHVDAHRVDARPRVAWAPSSGNRRSGSARPCRLGADVLAQTQGPRHPLAGPNRRLPADLNQTEVDRMRYQDALNDPRDRLDGLGRHRYRWRSRGAVGAPRGRQGVRRSVPHRRRRCRHRLRWDAVARGYAHHCRAHHRHAHYPRVHRSRALHCRVRQRVGRRRGVACRGRSEHSKRKGAHRRRNSALGGQSAKERPPRGTRRRSRSSPLPRFCHLSHRALHPIPAEPRHRTATRHPTVSRRASRRISSARRTGASRRTRAAERTGAARPASTAAATGARTAG
jgi:hypothetical protein